MAQSQAKGSGVFEEAMVGYPRFAGAKRRYFAFSLSQDADYWALSLYKSLALCGTGIWLVGDEEKNDWTARGRADSRLANRATPDSKLKIGARSDSVL